MSDDGNMREEEFELQVKLSNEGADWKLDGNGLIIIETIDALLMNPKLVSFTLKRKPKIQSSLRQTDNDNAPSSDPSWVPALVSHF